MKLTYADLFMEQEDPPLWPMNCPTCGRWARCVHRYRDGNPSEGDYWVFTVNCNQCGRGDIS